MPIFARFKSSRSSARERKIAALREMSAADLADMGLKPGDVARLEKEISSDS